MQQLIRTIVMKNTFTRFCRPAAAADSGLILHAEMRFRQVDLAKLPLLLCSIIVIWSLTSVNLPAQHVHGVVELGVVVEGSNVAVSMNAPLSDVIGFEHAAESDQQVDIIKQAAALLTDADAMFGLADSANCRLSSISVDGPDYIKQYLLTEDNHSDGDHHHGHDSHASEPTHDEHEDSSAHGHHHHDDGQHGEINANYQWTCGDTTGLQTLELRFNDGFASVETIDIQILTPAGAHVVKARAGTRSVSLTPP